MPVQTIDKGGFTVVTENHETIRVVCFYFAIEGPVFSSNIVIRIISKYVIHNLLVLLL